MKLINKLKKLTHLNNLERYIINYIFEVKNIKNDDDLKLFFKDLLQNGCETGMITTLICYNDIKKFYFDFESEIRDVINNLEHKNSYSKKGFYFEFVFTAFEETARNLANKINLDFNQ